MRIYAFFCFFTFLLASSFSLCGKERITNVSEDLDSLIQKASKETPTLENSEPDKRITDLLSEITEAIERLSPLNEENLEEDDRKEHIKVLMKGSELYSLLEERRVFRYMLWAEKCLRNCTSSKLDDLSQKDLFELYQSLSDINLSLIPEAILTREITIQLATIYDHLDAAHKPEARLEAIRRSADKKIAEKNNFRRRKTLDEF